MANLLEAICNIYEFESKNVQTLYNGANRINNVGDGLELFIKKAFASNLGVTDERAINANDKKTFSYLGGSTTPPDMMLKHGDAIEVKKTESVGTQLQLNSSHPKDRLKTNSPFITKACRDCEDWEEKDMLYAIGCVPQKSSKLESLFFIYGDLYAANEEVYLGLKNGIRSQVSKYGELQPEKMNAKKPSKEIGRVNFVDPLKITHLRIRGMWLLQPPIRVFSYLFNYNKTAKFQLNALLTENKYNMFPESSRKRIESLIGDKFSINEVEVKNPNNPAKYFKAKHISILDI